MIAPTAPGCLTADELVAFHLGELPEEELPRVAAHLESCPACDQAAGALDTLIDPTLVAYRQTARTAPPPDPGALPDGLPGYELLAELGRGGMGVVYKARDRRLQRVVALKMLLGGDFADREHRQRFRAEAEAVARLQHPNIVQLFEADEHDPGSGYPRPYFTLEYVDGGSLDRRLAGRPLPPRQAAEWLEPLARAVHFAHTQGIIHRDLKPSNVLLTADGTPKVCDFGVAKRLTDPDQKTVSGMILGTVEYMAPEQAAGTDVPGPAADVYALGVILYECLAGRPPFKGATTLDTLSQVQTQEPVPVRRLQPAVPRDLETVCLKCLAKEPTGRYPSAEALADDLRRFLAGVPIVARPAGTWERAVKLCRRRPVEAGLAAAVVVALAAGAGVAGWQWQRAVTERNNALGLADDLRGEREAAEWQTYRAKVAAAAGALQLGNVAAARRHLDAAPAQHRNWEWRHLVARLDGAQAVLGGHTGPIRGLAFTRDGRRLLSAADRTVRVWDAGTGTPLAVLGHDEAVRDIALRPDGGRLACATRAGTLYLHDLTARAAPAVRRPAGGDSYFMAFTADGSRVCLGTTGGVVVEDAATGEDRHALRDPKSYRHFLAVSPDGRQAAVGDSDRAVRLWNLADGRLGEPLRGHTTRAVLGAFGPNGRLLVTAGQHPDNDLRLWRPGERAEPVARLPGHTRQLYAVAVSPDGSRIASAGGDRTPRLWDAATGRLVAALEGHAADVFKLAFSPDGRRLLTGSDDMTLRVWDAATGRSLSTLRGHAGAVRAIAWSPDGTRVASGASDAVVRLWDLTAAAGQTDILRGHTDTVSDLAYTPDGGRIVSISPDGNLRLWDAATRAEAGRLTPGQALNWSVALNPTGTLAVAVAPEAAAGYLLDLTTGTLKGRLAMPEGVFTSRGCAFHPDGALAAGGGADGAVHLWDVATGRHLAALKGHAAKVMALAVSPDGRHLASGAADGSVRVWDLEARRPVAELSGYTGAVYSVAYSADGGRLAAGGADQTVRVWDARTRAEAARLRHDAAALAVRFHPDGTRLAVACGDGTVRLWDTATNEEVAELRGHAAAVQALAFSPDGTQLASGAGDFTVRVWGTTRPRRPTH